MWESPTEAAAREHAEWFKAEAGAEGKKHAKADWFGLTKRLGFKA